MPMEGITLAANAVLAPMMLGEEITRDVVWSTIIIIFGIGVTVSFGPHSSASYDTDDLLDLLQATPFVVFFLFCVVSSLVAWGLIHWQKHRNKEAGVTQNGSMEKQGARVICCSYIWIAAIFSSGTMLTAKQTMELLETTLSGVNQFDQPTVWVILFNFICMNVVMEYWKQKALASFSALVVVPLFQVMLVVLAVITGAIYFDEFKGMAAYSIICFSFGLVIVCYGMFVLAGGETGATKRQMSIFTSVYCILVAKRWLWKVRNKRLRGSPSPALLPRRSPVSIPVAELSPVSSPSNSPGVLIPLAEDRRAALPHLSSALPESPDPFLSSPRSISNLQAAEGRTSLPGVPADPHGCT